MLGTEKDEPYNDFIEEVYIGTNYCGHRLDAIVTFDSRTGGRAQSQFCFAENYKFT